MIIYLDSANIYKNFNVSLSSKFFILDNLCGSLKKLGSSEIFMFNFISTDTVLLKMLNNLDLKIDLLLNIASFPIDNGFNESSNSVFYSYDIISLFNPNIEHSNNRVIDYFYFEIQSLSGCGLANIDMSEFSFYRFENIKCKRIE